MHKKGISRFSVVVSCLTVPKQFVEETFCVSENFWHRNILCIRRGYHEFLSRFLSHTTEKFRERTLLCFRKFLVSKNLCVRGRCHDFLSRFFVSHYRKISWKNPSVLQKISGIEKCMHKRTMSRFSFEFFCLSAPKHFVKEPFCVSEKSLVSKHFLHTKGISRFFFEVFCRILPKYFVKETICASENFWYRKILRIGRG